MLEPGMVIQSRKVKLCGSGVEFALKPSVSVLSIIIGTIKKGDEPPSDRQLALLAGYIGLVKIDDVEEILGKKQRDKLVAGMNEKYKPEA